MVTRRYGAVQRNPLPALLLLALPACAGRGAAVPLSVPVPVAATAVLPPQSFGDLAALDVAIRDRLRLEPGEFGVAGIDLETGRRFGTDQDLVMHAASTMKVPVLLELYRRAAAGTIDLDASVEVRNRFRSIADTTHFYSLVPADDSEHALYSLIGRRTTYRDLARRMTVRSSNLATNILIDELGATAVQYTADRVGGDGMRVLRGVEDGPAFRAGLNNTTTARGLANVLAAIARCDILPQRLCAEVVDILAAQEFTELIPAGLPPGTRVAHKTGWITGIQHDGAIIYPAGSPPFVLVVLTRGAADTLAARRVAADVAALAWHALGPGGTLRPHWPAATAELLELHRRVRVPAFPGPRLGPAVFHAVLNGVVDAAPNLERREVGRSLEGRVIQEVRFGRGPTRVLLWSQMHGDETTASRALVDLFHYIATAPDEPRVRHWAGTLTVTAVPMLNPDGADAHRRRGAHGIDINRDARMLATPEGRTLKRVQEAFQPHFGFNLHDQNPRARVGTTERVAAMSLLAPPPDAQGTPTPAFLRAQQLTAHLASAMAPLVGAHLTRFDDSYNARAFGDGMQAWGVSTVLIETGSWHGDGAAHYLRAVNFAALVAALDAIASGTYADADVARYLALPRNGRAVNDLLIRGGTVVLPGAAPFRADIAIDAAAVGGPAHTQIVDVGDLQEHAARDSVDATGMFVHVLPGADGRPSVQPGTAPHLAVRRTADPSSELVWSVTGVTVRRWVARQDGRPRRRRLTPALRSPRPAPDRHGRYRAASAPATAATHRPAVRPAPPAAGRAPSSASARAA
jgi:beta-lactamase class A